MSDKSTEPEEQIISAGEAAYLQHLKDMYIEMQKQTAATEKISLTLECLLIEYQRRGHLGQ